MVNHLLDVELNPGLKSVNLLEACNSIHSFDIICLSETFLDLTIQFDHPDLLMNNYT